MNSTTCDRAKGIHCAVLIVSKRTPDAEPTPCCKCTLERYEILYNEMPFQIVEAKTP